MAYFYSVMEGFYINKDGSTLSADTGNSKLSLLASCSDLEVMTQMIYPDSVVWITPASDKTTIEFFYVLSGSIILMPDSDSIELQQGDSFYADGLLDDVLIKVNEPSKLLYITNKPLFDEVLSFQGDLESLMRRVDEKDNYTYQHSRNVMDYSLLLFRKLCPNEPYHDITTAALFHDVGKCLVPDDILKKPGKLTDSEFRQMMKHPVNSGRLLINQFGEKIAEVARSHHERMDGSGYPFGLSGEEIPFESRIIAVADSFDAMTSRRIYRDYVKSFEEAADELYELEDLYDRKVSEALLELVRSGEINNLPKGDCIEAIRKV